MMRKDVRIGFAIGAVLLAVLIVYGLVTSGPKNNEVTLAEDTDAPASSGDSSVGGNSQSTSTSEPAPPSERAAGPAAQRDPLAADRPADGTGRERPTTSPAATAGDQWEHVLTKGELPPVLMTRAPTPEPRHTPSTSGDNAPAAPQGAQIDPASAGAGIPTATDAADSTDAGGSSTAGGATANTAIDARTLADMAQGPTTLPVDGTLPGSRAAQRTHVVQHNETFASIAEMAYGSEAYYPHLMRANPEIDPRRLRAGMTIVLPPREQVVARPDSANGAGGSGTGSSAVATAPVDEQTQYRVQPSDSLYKISLKLYGRADKVNAIYELNKDQIGPNPSRLRAGLLLKLPEPPTATASTR